MINTVKLGDVISYKKGFAFKSDNYRSDGVRVIRISDTTRTSIKLDSGIFVSEENSRGLEDYRLSVNDIILTTVGSRPPMYGSMVGKAISVPIEAEGSLLNQNMVILRGKAGIVNQRFLALSLRTPQFIYFIETLIRGNANQVSIALKDFFKYKLTLPNLAGQGEIVELLSKWEEAISRTETLIAAKRKQFKALVQRFISKKCENWDHLHARDIFQTVSIKNKPDEELLSVTQDRGAIPRNMLKGRVMSPAGSTAGYKLVIPGNFIVSLRSFQGGLEYSEYRGIVSPAYTILETKIDLDTSFYRHFLKSYIFIEKYLTVAVIGIRDGKQISAPDFATVKIPVPPIEQQKSIGKILDTANEEIEALEKIVDKYRSQKRGLMQKLLTGEWHVKGAA
jgi:type I restriction enzyme, S subunit